MPSYATDHQRALMRTLYRQHGGNAAAACAAFAEAEAEGRVFRKRGDLRLPPEDYARKLLAHGLAAGWIADLPG